jgi:glycosyltransferase involved in cell wall biosynthesis
MIGTSPGARSGIAAVVEVYEAHGLFRRWNVRYLATHADGGKLRKAALALTSWLRFCGALLAGRVALLHVLIASNASFWRKSLFAWPARLAGVPVVLHVHCGKVTDFYAGASAPARWLIRALLRHADAVLALSPQWRDGLAQIEPAARLRVVPNPVLLPDKRAALRGNRPTVLFLGMLTEAKGALDLLRAWPAVLERVPDARLVLGGAGDLEGLRAQAEAMGVGHAVELPGWVRDEAKAALLQGAWVFSLPSHAEALPMSVLEAMAAGVPAVASNVGGIPLAVQHGVTGLLVEPRDEASLARSIADLLDDPARRIAMGHAAREKVAREFSCEAVLPPMEAIWAALLKRAPSSATVIPLPRSRPSGSLQESSPRSASGRR